MSNGGGSVGSYREEQACFPFPSLATRLVDTESPLQPRPAVIHRISISLPGRAALPSFSVPGTSAILAHLSLLYSGPEKQESRPDL